MGKFTKTLSMSWFLRTKKKSGFCIVIPTINQKKLLVNALDWYLTNLTQTEIIVLDNGKQGLVSGDPRLKIFEPAAPKGVAASWNWLITKAIQEGYTKFLVLNDDIILKRYTEEIDALFDSVSPMTFVKPHVSYNWSAYLLTKEIFTKVGGFDEGFEKCFYEDNDYEYRMKLAGCTITHSDLLNAQVYLNSQSSIADPRLSDFTGNRNYYERKWGGLPNAEKYTTPFNS